MANFFDSPRVNNILLSLLIGSVIFQTTRIIANQDRFIEGLHALEKSDVRQNEHIKSNQKDIANITNDVREIKEYIFRR